MAAPDASALSVPSALMSPAGRVSLATMRLDALVSAPYNPRRISDEALAGLGASVRRFGLVQPVIWNKRTGHVVGGHQRVKALAAQGVVETDVVVVDLQDVEERALNLSLNSPAISGEFTADALTLIDEVAASLPDLASALLFSDLRDAVEDALPRIVRDVTEDDVPPPPAIPVSKPGDLYLLGNHRLICGDSTDPAVVARVLGGAAPRLLLTDPPYGVELDMEWRDRAGLNALGPAQASYLRGEGHRNTSISGDTRADWSAAFELVPSLDTAYVWHASAFSVEVGEGLRRIGFDLKQQIIWRKPHFALSRQHYHWQHEPCWYARKPGSAPFLGSRDQSTIWDAASPKMLMSGSAEEKVDHPTQKPVALYARPIQNHLEEGDVFYEPFGGSGTAVAAAEQTGRRCCAVELDPKYVDVIVARWERLSGRKAERQGA
jgi:DNA modification methylase